MSCLDFCPSLRLLSFPSALLSLRMGGRHCPWIVFNRDGVEKELDACDEPRSLLLDLTRPTGCGCVGTHCNIGLSTAQASIDTTTRRMRACFALQHVNIVDNVGQGLAGVGIYICKSWQISWFAKLRFYRRWLGKKCEKRCLKNMASSHMDTCQH